jgi:hypothetical protein
MALPHPIKVIPEVAFAAVKICRRNQTLGVPPVQVRGTTRNPSAVSLRVWRRRGSNGSGVSAATGSLSRLEIRFAILSPCFVD